MEKQKTIDPNLLPKHFDYLESYAKLYAKWEELGIHRYNPDRPRSETFTVDTPPPTVSGSLHIGHVFSYTHTDILVRFNRMRGKNIFYPMGYDDNGLPTERRVQNYFHIRCNPDEAYVPGLSVPVLTEKEKKTERPKLVSRANFIELCHQVTKEDEKKYRDLWEKMGLSVDWDLEYATIDDRCRTLAQLSFLDLLEKGHAYSSAAPSMWDVDFQTAVAQAEIEDREVPGAFHHIRFGVQGSDESFVIATTRPELLAACVGVTANPNDDRYKHLFGKFAVTPLFKTPVPIFPSELALQDKGTGILMVCTFGDQTDVLWWREQKLKTRQIIEKNGRLRALQFGNEEFESLDPALANSFYQEISGKNVKQAQAKMVELLRDPKGAAVGSEAPLVGEPKPLSHAVKFYEKGERALELVPTRQWFVRVLDKKKQLLEKTNEIKFHPEFMNHRLKDWIENLNQDWCISRQRYFGVAFPIWYKVGPDGKPQYDQILKANKDQLPVDPLKDLPPGYSESQRNIPGGFMGEADVYDTWFTSSLSPQIGSHWLTDTKRHEKLFPATMRPQAHEIIRTWAFYTVTKAMLHENKIPWEHIVISGWVLAGNREKISKSKGNSVMDPPELIKTYGADALRYWSGSARLGADTAFDENVLKVGKRLSTKIYNASKFALAHEANLSPITNELDRSFLAHLSHLVAQATAAFEEMNFSQSLHLTESFFWQKYTDTYLELVKYRAQGREGVSKEDQGSAVTSLRLGLNILLRLFAPVIPFITEEIWSWVYADETSWKSIHQAPWPNQKELGATGAKEFLDVGVAFFEAVNKKKTENALSLATPIQELSVAMNPESAKVLSAIKQDLCWSVKVQDFGITEDPGLKTDEVKIMKIAFEG